MENKVVNLQVKDNLDETTKSVGSLKSQLREAQNEVTALSDKFGATSKEAIEAAKRAGELKDKIGDAKALTEAFNPDAKFKSLSASLTGVAGGFSVVTGAMGAFGTNSKAVEEQLLKVQSAMAMASGLQAVGESIDSFKQLGAVLKNTSLVQKVMTAATATYTFVTGAATTGLKLFRLALIGTGIGALVVGVGLLIANFDKVKATIMNLIPGLAKVGDFIGGIVESITDFVGATSDASRALDKLKNDADNTLSVNKRFMQEHGDQVDAYTKKKIDAKNAYAEAVKEDGANQVALAKKLNRELNAIDNERQAEKDKKNKEANDKIVKANEDAEKKRVEKVLESRKKDLVELENNLTPAAQSSVATLKIISANQVMETLQAQDHTAARIQISEAEAAAKTALFQKTSQTLMAGADLLGKNTAAGKSMAVAAALINTYQGITAELATKTVTPFEIGLKVANVAIIAATGFKAVKNILSVPVPGGGGGGASPSTGGMTPAAPQFNVIGASGQNQIAQSIGNQNQQPIQAYVVAGAVTTGQSLNRNIISNASMG